MLNIVIPMAGAGSRFAAAGFSDPKPLIPINGVAMIRVVIHNLRPAEPHRFIFICQQAHIDTYGLTDKLAAWAPGCHIIGLNGLSAGAACTVLAAQHLIDSAEPLMIANSDQYIDVDINDYLAEMPKRHLDGLIMTMKANDPKWSFVGFAEGSDRTRVTSVVEKQVISDEATVGIYNFLKGSDFVAAAHRMIQMDLRVNNEFYVAPAYNELIKAGQHIGIYNVGQEADGMYGLGIPADLALFKSMPVYHKATAPLL